MFLDMNIGNLFVLSENYVTNRNELELTEMDNRNGPE